jgi:hypothetical protein
MSTCKLVTARGQKRLYKWIEKYLLSDLVLMIIDYLLEPINASKFVENEIGKSYPEDVNDFGVGRYSASCFGYHVEKFKSTLFVLTDPHETWWWIDVRLCKCCRVSIFTNKKDFLPNKILIN